MRLFSQIALRALSPALDDPATAIDLATRARRILAALHDTKSEIELPYPRLHVSQVTVVDLPTWSLVAQHG